MPDCHWIRIRGARQNNLRNLDLDLPTGELIVVTGVSGSGKSSLVFDTLYAEGQRRYVETFSPYARQFLDRMDRPAVDRIEGVPPAIAIDQTNPVRTSRSTVGTMTEINDHLKLLFARASQLYCRKCGREVRRDTPASIVEELLRRCDEVGQLRVLITFPVRVPANFTSEEIRDHLRAQGYNRVHARHQDAADGAALTLDVLRDRMRLDPDQRQRLLESIEEALRLGGGRVDAWIEKADAAPAGAALEDAASENSALTTATSEQPWARFSSGLHCAHCDIHYNEPSPSTFSFNSPLGACDTCRGFGRVIGIDYELVIPDSQKSLREGAIKPWQTASFRECQQDMEKYAARAAVDLDTPWQQLDERARHWVLAGDPKWTGNWKTQWYGLNRFFEWLESRAYKMHIRVLLSRYRSYTTCPACAGTRLKPDALLWRLDLGAHASGYTLHELMLIPVQRLRALFDPWREDAADEAAPEPRSSSGAQDAATQILVGEIRSRLRFLCEVGLGYLTLDRQSRTLSGGEVQRINLTTALGTSLVNTLFVLDEPSIGLHPRDMQRVIGVMQRLRTSGNSLVVVEHDPQIMLAADRIIDMGPGPGESGGQIVFQGLPEQLQQADTITGAYLGGRRRIETPGALEVQAATPRIVLEGVREHNLKSINVEFPLNRLVAVTGVSGSGKSTLIQDVLYPALRKALRKSGVAALVSPGAYDRCLGADWIEDVALVDQSPIGKTTRSNPASVVGAFDPIRRLFAQAPLAKERHYTAGTFSFNTGAGRCPTCGGNGFEHVEMQFLSDVYLRCPDCNGKRFRPEVLEVQLQRGQRSLSIADTLELTVAEAAQLFAADAEVVRNLAPLADVGLDYLRLGQPVPTLSGGEAQRLKIAAFLAEAIKATPSKRGNGRRGSLLLFDEPTTGLHFEDIARLMRALRKLLAAGHSLIVIEHNLDVIRASDWVIDLGPEGGDAGGSIVVTGDPDQVTRHPTSHTARALREYTQSARTMAASASIPATPADAGTMRLNTGAIELRNAREHNLKGIDVSIPRDTFTVITGISGSGKSTLAFDILFQEGQRRYLESLNAYARSMVQPAARPNVDAIYGIPPTVSIEQRVSRGGRKSTVATQTELHHFLRLLFVKLGTQYCPQCQLPVQPQSFATIVASILREWQGREIGILAPLIVHRKGLYTELARWAANKGHTHLRVDGRFVPTRPWARLDRFQEHSIDLPVGSLLVQPEREDQLRALVQAALEQSHGMVEVTWPMQTLRKAIKEGRTDAALERRVFSVHRACSGCGQSFPEPDPRMFSYNSKHGWCTHCFGTGLQLTGFAEENTGEEIWWNEWYEGEETPCPACEGRRLNPVSLAVRFGGHSIADLGAMTVEQARAWVGGLDLTERAALIARDVVSEIRARLDFLAEVGLAYLALDRAAPTLSGGEAQRIRLAAQLGSNLQGVCYILDEPTIGLHARDNGILLRALRKLESRGNTLVVVEHDEDTIRAAQHLIDIGPGAGSRGGQVVAQGGIEDLIGCPDSITGRHLRRNGPRLVAAARPMQGNTPVLGLRGAALHNLRDIDVDFPLGRLIVVTGVSGSGKSTLARDVLLSNMRRALSETAAGGRRRRKAPDEHGGAPRWHGCREISGWTSIARVLEVDQTPIGKTPRSCTATYVGIWDAIRKRYAETTEAKVRGFTASRFSFNTAGGRCPACEGQGLQTIEMSFLPDVKVVCDSCAGLRFEKATLEVLWRGKSIGDVLQMSIDEAAEFFATSSQIAHALRLLQDVGLGYLTLGQSSPTLSGGEAQRIKLVTELAKARAPLSLVPLKSASGGAADGTAAGTLYVLDEPTVGLSMADVQMLLQALHRLVDAGHTVVIVEHNLDMIAQADWIIDLGPDGGERGGQVVGVGPPARVAAGNSPTGEALRRWMRGT
ncbi:MAG TPA: excinuclease ABC subunit UvrA [Burkholderiaceae bacterium]|nr:excinuclease ABC subunit UvrA [Burkholderiaceae bacterium]